MQKEKEFVSTPTASSIWSVQNLTWSNNTASQWGSTGKTGKKYGLYNPAPSALTNIDLISHNFQLILAEISK